MIKISVITYEEKKLEYMKYRLQYIYKIIKLFVSSTIILTIMIYFNYSVFSSMLENMTVVYAVIGIDSVVVLLLMGVSITNIIQLLQQFRLFKNNQSSLAIEDNTINEGDS